MMKSNISRKIKIVVIILFSIIQRSYSQKIDVSLNDLGFIENKGQIHDQFGNSRSDVLSNIELGMISYYFMSNSISYQLSEIIESDSYAGLENNPQIDNKSLIDSVLIHRLDLEFIDANPETDIELISSLKGKSHFYTSKNGKGFLNVRSFKELKYHEIYTGIDLRYYTTQYNLEYDFIVKPYIDSKKIQWRIKGADDIQIDEKGNLLLYTSLGVIMEKAPVAYQENRNIQIGWKVVDDIVSFQIGEYDSSKKLTIDPVVRVWGTYFGGSGAEDASDLAIDDSSNIYMCGKTSSLSQIATTGQHQTTFGGGFWDAYLTKFDALGNRIWTTYYGGKEEEEAFACAIDDKYNIYMAGTTDSDSGISTLGVHQPVIGQDTTWVVIADDAFLVKFNYNGFRQWATYYGGKYVDEGIDCAVDSFGNVYLSGETQSFNGIASLGAHSTTKMSSVEPFLAKFDSSGARIWGTYIGGSNPTSSATGGGGSCVVDKQQNVYLAGYTKSSIGLATTGAHQTTFAGDFDGFLAKFNGSGVIQWATYYGGSSNDYVHDCQIDDLNNVIITGFTYSSSGIANNGSYQSALDGLYDVFIAKFSHGGTRAWGTYYGGGGAERAESCAIDNNGSIYITGKTTSDSSIATLGSHKVNKGVNNESFISKFTSNGALDWGSYYANSGSDIGRACAVDQSNFIYMAGRTFSNSGISTPNAYKTALTSGYSDAFVVKFKNCDVTSSSIFETNCFQYTSPSNKHIWFKSGTYKDTLINTGGCDSIVTIHLTIDTVNTKINTNQDTLISLAQNATYQWYNCDTKQNVDGATGKSYYPEENGNYAVIVTQNGCVDSSSCYQVTGVGINNSINEFAIHLYPNPTKGMFTIDLGKEYLNVTVSISDQNGRKVSESTYSSAHIINQQIEGSAGIYLIKVQTEKGETKSFSILKKR